MSKRKTVAVIGGGVSGLAAAKAFDAQGHRVLGYERSHDFGGVWELSRSYPDVQTQSPKDLYCYIDHPMPAENPEWPKGPQVHAYLHSYAAKHKLGRLFHLNTNVVSMDRRADGRPGWNLTLESAGRERSQDVDFVAICTGQFSDKNIIAHPGQDDFIAQGGQVIHSSEYTDPEMIRGKRVAVLGGSKSATDIAVSAAKRGATSVTLVYRQNVWRVPYFVGDQLQAALVHARAGSAVQRLEPSVTPSTSTPLASNCSLKATRVSRSFTLKAICCTEVGVLGPWPISGLVGNSIKASTLPCPVYRNRCIKGSGSWVEGTFSSAMDRMKSMFSILV